MSHDHDDGHDLMSRLVDYHDHIAAPLVPVGDDLRRGRRRVRRTRGLVAGGVALGLASVVVAVTLFTGGRADDVIEPADKINVSLPIEYPVGQELPALGDAPGPLAAIWVTPGAGDGASEVVGLVAETGVFGTLSIDVRVNVDYGPTASPGVALSPDGRRIAYNTGKEEDGAVVAHDLVSGEKAFPAIEGDGLYVYDWFDATHLYGNAGSYDSNGWLWEPGKPAKLVDFVDYPYPGAPYLGAGWPYGGPDLEIGWQGPPQSCGEPMRVFDSTDDDPSGFGFDVPVLCDVMGVVGSQVLLGHWDSEHLAGEANDPGYAAGTVVALDISGTPRAYFGSDLPRDPLVDQAFEDPTRRYVVVSAGAPHRVAFATDVIRAALESSGGRMVE
jgi:hypothetical protein